MSDITRENHKDGELWASTSVPNNNIYIFDPAWIDSVVSTLKINQPTVETKIEFRDGDNTVGKLYVENGMLKFEGAHDPSVRAFLTSINMGWLEEIQMTKKVAAHEALERCLEIIDQWSENQYALVTELVKQLKQDDYFR